MFSSFHRLVRPTFAVMHGGSRLRNHTLAKSAAIDQRWPVGPNAPTCGVTKNTLEVWFTTRGEDRVGRIKKSSGIQMNPSSRFLLALFACLLFLSTTAGAQTKYFVSVNPSQGGLASTIISNAGYDSLEAAEQAAVQYVNAFVPTPCIDVSCSTAPVPTSGRKIKFHKVRQDSAGGLEYEYQSDWFGFQFMNQTGLNCMGAVARDSLEELLPFIPAHCASAQVA